MVANHVSLDRGEKGVRIGIDDRSGWWAAGIVDENVKSALLVNGDPHGGLQRRGVVEVGANEVMVLPVFTR